MKITLNAKMIVAVLNAYVKRNFESEGFEVDSYLFEKNDLVVTMKLSEPKEEEIEVDETDPED
jgi:hypothetical protein